jgi:endonuclease-3
MAGKRRPARRQPASGRGTRKRQSRPAARRRPGAVARPGRPARPAAAKASRRPRRPQRPRRIERARLPEHAAEIYRRLAALYPDAHCELDHHDAWQLLVATILSAQCTDKRVNMVTPILFARYPTPAALAAAPREDVEEIIRSTGFFRNKAKSIVRMAAAVADEHGGRVPDRMEELVLLPGVGRKTANVVLGNAFDRNEGVVVDTHVARLSARLGLSRQTDPVRIERDLMALFPRETWAMLSHLLIWHGRRVCDAKKPRCAECVLSDICPSSRA